MENIKILRLITGDEVIAFVNPGLTVDTVILKKPMRLMYTEQGLAMMPLSIFIKDSEITLNIKDIIYRGAPEEELYNEYNGKFGSGIIKAPPGFKLD